MGAMCACLRLCGHETIEQDRRFKKCFLLVFSEQLPILEARYTVHSILRDIKNCEELCSGFATLRKNSVWIRISGLKQSILDIVSVGSLANEPTWDNTSHPFSTEGRHWGLNGGM